MNFLPRGELRTIVVTSEVQRLGPVSFKSLIDTPPKWASEEESVFKKIAPYKFWKHFHGVLIFKGSFQPFSEDIFHGSFNSLRRRQEFRKVQNSALESRWTDSFQILWNISDLQEILMLKMFFAARRGSFWSVVSELGFGLIGAFSQGKNPHVPWGFGVASKKPRLSWAKSAALKADGLKKNWEMLGWIWLQLGMLQRFIRYMRSKAFQIPSNWWCFCFWRAIDDEECLAFQEHKKTWLCHPLAAGICRDWRKQQLQKQFTSFQLNMPMSWWICSNSEIPLWTFPHWTVFAAKANLLRFHPCAVGRWDKDVPNA